MAIKKFLMENGKQVWPITRADCIYTTAGDKLLNVAIEEQHAAMQKAIDDEIARAKAAEKANADEIANMKNADLEGSLANKIAVNTAAIAQEKQDREADVQDLQGQINALLGEEGAEGSIGEQINAVKEELQGAIDDVADALANEKDANVEGSLQAQINAEAARAAGKEGELAQAITDNKDAQDEVNEDFESRIAANEAFVAAQPAKDQAQDGRLDALEALFEGDNSVDAKIAAAEAAAKQHAENKDAALKQELEGKIDAKVAQADYDVKMAALDAEDADIRVDFAAADQALQANIDKKVAQADYDVKVAELAAEDTAIRGAFAAADAQVLADAKAYADEKDTADKNAQAAIDKAQDDRIKALEDANAENGTIANAIKAAQDAADAAQADADALEQRLDAEGGLVDRIEANEAFVADQPAIDEAQNDRIKALEDDAPVKQAAIETAKKAADDAQAAADKAQGEVDAVEERMLAAEGEIDALQEFVNAHNHAQIEADIDALEEEIGVKAEYEENGDVKVAASGMYKYIDDQDAQLRNEIGAAVEGMEDAVAGEKSRAEGVEAAIRGELANEKAALQAEIDADVKVEKERAVAREDEIAGNLANEVTARENAVKAEKEAREAADNALDERLQAVEASVGDGGNLEARVAANEDAIEVINGTGEGSIKKAVADLVDGAPEALDTLNELAAALRDNAGVLDAVEEAFDNKLATLQADVDQNEADCDAAIKAEKERAEGIEQGLQAAIDKLNGAADAEGSVAKAVKDAVDAEANRAKAAEEANADAIEAEQGRAEAAEQALGARIDAIFAAYDGDQEYDDLAPLA